jgi:hypothetical protein
MFAGAVSLLRIKKQQGKGIGVALAAIVIGTFPFIITIISILLITIIETPK